MMNAQSPDLEKKLPLQARQGKLTSSDTSDCFEAVKHRAIAGGGRGGLLP